MSEYQVTPEQEKKWREEFEKFFCEQFIRGKPFPDALEGLKNNFYATWEAARAIDAKRIEELEAQAEIAKQLLTRSSKSIGDFVSDHGWTISDMDTMDSIDAFLEAAKRKGD